MTIKTPFPLEGKINDIRRGRQWISPSLGRQMTIMSPFSSLKGERDEIGGVRVGANEFYPV